MVRKRYSKKSKSVWRKKTDISDVEAHLEEVRRDERLGGPASLKSNDELFYVERGTEDAKSDQVPAIKEKKNRKRKPLTIESLLKPVSKVEAIKRKTNSKDYNLDLELKKKKKLIGKTSNSKEKVPDNSNSQQVYSLWQSDESLAANNSKGIKKGDQIASTTKDQYKRPVSVAKIETEVPNVQICSSGASYNPAYDDHQVLLRDAIDEEMKSLKKQEKLDRKLALPENFQNDVTTWKEEMSCGLFQTEENEDDVNSSASDDDIAVGNTRTGARRRLTLREKRLKKIRKLRAMANNDVKLKKSRMQDIYRWKATYSKIDLRASKEGALLSLENQLDLYANVVLNFMRRNLTGVSAYIKVNERLHVIKDSNCGDYRNICDDIRLCMSIRVVHSIRCVAYDLVVGTL
ncbi:uncharacterized protein TRIADDRAFT_57084 [Trichoplax adhaerens]|uniref:Ribosome biogenesis protein NOP53 n=1 Tax=Trichoplax adhaerens TaxID=10228 RepID=B3S0K6_TRIAD|nr:hypothetical protein TRIADDRAFT_57084 [Trichoplax adhaerens]EDV24026.1 hypothetical protein TRIADDRAFT_57084 [Trichoplax adhaerens]|eukprot:XP_002113552.1 hypothetical protein TRIADDRAFT_57084 [Trichoplax adhaerens]